MKMNRESLHCYVEQHQDNICGIVALRNGQVRYSDYWRGYGPRDTVHVMSVTKSVVSLLTGMALDQGLIRDVRQPVLDFFPEYQVKRGERTIQKVTLEHLLTMTAPYKYRSEPWTKVCSSNDWTRAALDLLGGRSGLTGEFKYATLGIHILMGVLAAASGLPTAEFANRWLFAPLGVPAHRNYEAETAEEHKHFIMDKQPKGDIWFSDPQQVNTAGFGLCLSAMDMAKLGQLCLNGGLYDDRRIVSEAWLAASTRPRYQCGEGFAHMRYGYLWWTPDADREAYAALGNSGNVIYVDPARRNVVAVAASFKPSVLDRVRFIREYIEPMLEAEE